MIPIEQPAVGLDETRASEPETTSDEEFLVASLREKGEPEFSADRILVQESGAVGIALETAYPIAEGRGLVLRGWVSDPYDTVESIWLRIGERSQRVKLSRTYFRQDVIDHKKLADIRPGYRAGFDLIEKVKLPSAASARIALHAIFRQQTGRSVISSGKIVDLSKSAS